MPERTLEVKMSVKVSDQDLADILVTAFEGGSNYWIDSVASVGKPAEQDLYTHFMHGGTIKIRELDEKEAKILSIESLATGLKTYAGWCFEKGRRFDAEDLDADAADAILQFALFGELVYG